MTYTGKNGLENDPKGIISLKEKFYAHSLKGISLFFLTDTIVAFHAVMRIEDGVPCSFHPVHFVIWQN